MRKVVNMRSPSRRCALLGGLVILVALVFSEVSAKKERPNSKKDEKSSRQSRGIWIGGDHKTGMDHGHGHGWMKLHNERHHDHSTKLSEAYVKFHGLGEKEGSRNRGFLTRITNAIKALGIGRGDPEEESNGWSSNSDNSNNNNNNNNNMGSGGGWGSSSSASQQQQMITISIPSSASAGGSGGWGAPPPPPQQSSGGGGGWGAPQQQQQQQQQPMSGGGWGPPPAAMMMQSGWSNPQMTMVVAQPTGWASAQNQMSSGSSSSSGGSSGKGGNQRQPTGWASGDFASYKPPRGGNSSNKGHFQLNLPTGKPAYIQKLKPIIDLPKIALHGWRR